MTIDEQIEKADAKIAELEAALIVAQEHRRELVNRGNLNKQAMYEGDKRRCIEWLGAKL
jgi:hypothetical protein